MPKIRDILVHACVETAGKKRKCARKPSEHSIAKGEPCLVIKGGPYNAAKSYCRVCAKDILGAAEGRVSEFRLSLNL